MPELTLPGIRSDSLLGYLKGLGLLAIVSRQDDPQAAGAWSPPGFALPSPPGNQADIVARRRYQAGFGPGASG